MFNNEDYLENNDIYYMTRPQMTAEIKKLRDGIRYCRQEYSDSACHLDIKKLFELLPEWEPITQKLPPKEQFLKQCSMFHDSRSEVEFERVDEIYENWENDKPY